MASLCWRNRPEAQLPTEFSTTGALGLHTWSSAGFLLKIFARRKIAASGASSGSFLGMDQNASQLLSYPLNCLYVLVGTSLSGLNWQLHPALVLPGWISGDEPVNSMAVESQKPL